MEADVPELAPQDYGKTREKVAEAIGMKRSTFTLTLPLVIKKLTIKPSRMPNK